jgi:hypothetical protein
MEATNVQKLAEMGLTAITVTSFDWKQLPKHAADYAVDRSGDCVLVPSHLLENKVASSVDLREGKTTSVYIEFEDGSRLVHYDIFAIDGENELEEFFSGEFGDAEFDGWKLFE